MKYGISLSRWSLILATGIMVLLGSMLFVEAQTNVVATAPAVTTAPGAPIQTAPAQDTVLPNMLSRLNAWVTWMGVIVSVLSFLCVLLLGYTVGTSLLHYRQAAKEVEETKLLTRNMLTDFATAYDIAKLQTPDKILDVMHKDIDPRIEAVRAGLQNHDEHFVARIHELTEKAQNLKDQLTQRPTMEQILVEMDKKYRPPQDLQEKLLGRVLDAFLQVKKLEREEVESIRRILRADGQDGKVVDPPTSTPPKTE